MPEVGYHPVDKEGLSLFIALRWMQDPGWVMVWLAENIQACLRDFQTGTASMARKRHLASTARGFCGFCLMTLVTTGLLRPIRLIRGRKKERKKDPSSGVLPSRQRFGSRALIRGRCPRLLKVVPSRHQSARGVLVMRLPSRHRSACGVLVMRLPILIGYDAASTCV